MRCRRPGGWPRPRRSVRRWRTRRRRRRTRPSRRRRERGLDPRGEGGERLVVLVVVARPRPALGRGVQPGVELRAGQLPVAHPRAAVHGSSICTWSNSFHPSSTTISSVHPAAAGALGGLPVTAHGPATSLVGPDAAAGERLPEDPGLRVTGLGQVVVVGRSPRRLAVADQQDHPHPRAASRSAWWPGARPDRRRRRRRYRLLEELPQDGRPGETIKYTFVAKKPGVFFYHCGARPDDPARRPRHVRCDHR